ncbi:hypothetical protein A2303_07090 [Candidatus Falkowbacteria bacterium RIFOXYB2_FULL_47_14]|uniref:DAGKc domain-containing protein n=1 Tax=Candidatus Falkowbacteria bacterium RIFOXYA2_FULL_47_19 TaxID=1797994 RepID=A0A1F5SGB7_9BACT|nr:MAG: hypothetical protein A2227_00835 [Candidatus Falkowbacteria bacterium RIFOXYA2_FULL_47_19]OGF34917.1 MAG: hypothetical protein A2468_06795 [Candidatus Falkowbacteria bacterium RIFOXYC2_FULL_46_15]OGF43632.1 MAG: hypothetical protein A2303_07090 [Candidatus Falkowbacteria bacterium RIFOXYB2_FULL_47_14]
MHIYIYDSYVNEKRFNSIIARVETRITDLGLNGKIIRLGIMSSLYDSIENELIKGAKTIIAVGNNSLLNQVINSVARLTALNSVNKNIPIGFIPVGNKDNEIADHLGISINEEACDILSARRVQKLDLGLINNYYFLTQATITTEGTTIEIDKNYSIEILEKGEVGVVNLPINVDLPDNIKSNAKDGVLELYIKTKNTKKFLPISTGKPNQSVFSFKKLKITNPKHSVLIDNSIKITTPVNITIANEKINLIVGKNRSF